MDLSKTFDTINHKLVLWKLHAYGFGKQALLVICSYLANRQQRQEISNAFIFWRDLIQGVPKGSVLGTLLFNSFT